MTVTVSVSGPAQKRSKDADGDTQMVEVVKTDVRYSEEFTDPQAFHRIACSQSASSVAGKLLPDEYYVERKNTDEWDVSYEGNSIEAREFAEAVAEDGELNPVEVLTLWLQNLGAPRIRRALHGVLQEEHSVDVDADAF